MTARHGKDMWEREQMVFDTFVTRAAFPLHYVFADHWLLDVFVVDEATRSQPVRLWLTVLLYALFTVMALWGWRAWARLARSS